MPRIDENHDAVTINKIAPSLFGLAVPIDTLVPDPENAREHPEDNLNSIKESLTLYGQVKPVVVRRATNVVIAGNGTMEAAKQLGWTKLAVSYVDMNEVEAAGYGLADNKTSDLAKWNYEVVKRLDSLIQQQAPGTAVPGWSGEELELLRVGRDNGHTDPDLVPEPPKTPVTRLGDIWTMGSHRLMCGDSSNPKHVKALMGGNKASLMATDPPYGVDFVGQKYNPRAKDWDGIKGDQTQGDSLRRFMSILVKTWLPYMNLTAAYYFWTASMQEGFASLEGIKDAGLHVQSQIIWAKNVLVLGQSDYQWKHENCWYAFLKGKKHRWYGGRDKTSVWEIKKVSNADYLHPMQKPTELYARSINYHTMPGDIVVEPFAGSGTQFIAAQSLNRRCYGMELDAQYADVCCERFFNFTGQQPILERTGETFTRVKTRRADADAKG